MVRPKLVAPPWSQHSLCARSDNQTQCTLLWSPSNSSKSSRKQPSKRRRGTQTA
jgi:hypothetical protein